MENQGRHHANPATVAVTVAQHGFLEKQKHKLLQVIAPFFFSSQALSHIFQISFLQDKHPAGWSGWKNKKKEEKTTRRRKEAEEDRKGQVCHILLSWSYQSRQHASV
jgi:hypothetical protein